MARKAARKRIATPKHDCSADVLVEMLDAAYRADGWHGPNLRSTIARVKLEQALWRPGPNKHNIAEIVLHCAYWKYVGVRRLTGAKRGGFALKGSNWFAFGDDKSKAKWRAARALLNEIHVQLIQTVGKMTPTALKRVPPGSKVTNLKMIYGLAAHDAYHAGQIRLLRGLQSS